MLPCFALLQQVADCACTGVVVGGIGDELTECSAAQEFDLRFKSMPWIIDAFWPWTVRRPLQCCKDCRDDCEFEPTSHHYDINGETYSVEFFHAGTMWGCVEEVRNGVEPNEHGTWNYGRDGWCDGSPVDAHVFDVTASVDLGATNELTYRAQSYGDDDARWTSALDHVYLDPVTLTDGCGGYMLMTAYLAFYDVV